MSQRRKRANLRAMGVGIGATVVVIALYLCGGLDWLELKTLDLRFRYTNSTHADPRIALVDIDDGALRDVGRWPWPRDMQAEFISIIAEAGAKAILYDVTLVEPEPIRSISPRDADFALDLNHLAQADVGTALPDLALRTAIKDAKRVYLAFDFVDPLGQQRTSSGPSPVPASAVELNLRTWIRRWLDEQLARWNETGHALFDDLFTALAAHAELEDARNPEMVAAALRWVLSEAATLTTSLGPAADVPATHIDQLTPVYYPLARAARRCGFVVFRWDIDGATRWMPLWVSHHGRLLPQLAFAVAFDELNWRSPDEWKSVSALGVMRYVGGEGSFGGQIDRDGRVLIPWLPGTDWTRQFGPQVSMAAVWQVFDRRQKMLTNGGVVRDALAELQAHGLLAAHRQYHDDLKRRLELESDLRRARYAGDLSTVGDVKGWIAQYKPVLAEGAAALRTDLASAMTSSTQPAVAAADAALMEAIRRAFASNDAYAVEIRTVLDELTSRLNGKLCLIGYTATALADMAQFPTSARAPGVMAHANLLNGLLTGQMSSWAPAWVNCLLALLLGAAASGLSALPRPRTTAVILLALAYVALAGALAFYQWRVWIALTPAVVAMLLSYGVVLLFRYIFLERESRQIATALGQYTSATLARQMAENAELCKRAETREVSAMFTDLRDFTGISERIGAERTQHVLNVCLGRCSEVMLRHEAMINKFIGDGIFAFWNPVIYPQADHALRACDAALDLQTCMRELKESQRAAGGDAVFGELMLRIGVATGPAVVGPCGSEQKYDYTCIGDTVNLAARLESANKFYGTGILVGDATQAAASERFGFRPLGSVRVKGRRAPVPIFELLGRKGAIRTEIDQYARKFGEAVTRFQQRDWAAARTAFEACCQLRPDDLAARRYLEAVLQSSAQPPPADWSGAMELLEK